MTVYVYAVDAVFWGGLASHIEQEILEREPSCTYLYPASTIILPLLVRWSVATHTDIVPTDVFSGFLDRVAMCERNVIISQELTGPLAMPASA